MGRRLGMPGPVQGMPGGSIGEAVGQIQGSRGTAGDGKADPGIPGMPWGRARNARTDPRVRRMLWGGAGDARASAGDAAGQMWGSQGCRGAAPAMPWG